MNDENSADNTLPIPRQESLIPHISGPLKRPDYLPSLKLPEQAENLKQLWQQIQGLAQNFADTSPLETLPDWAIALSNINDLQNKREDQTREERKSKQEQLQRQQTKRHFDFQTQNQQLEMKKYQQPLEKEFSYPDFETEKQRINAKSQHIEDKSQKIQERIDNISKFIEKNWQLF